MFDLSITKLLVLAVIALVIFGPKELPKIAAQAGRALRDLRRIAEGAKADLRDGLGPEFAEFDFEDLNPRRFMQKHLMDDMTDGTTTNGSAAVTNGSPGNGRATSVPASAVVAPAAPALAPGQSPPFDIEAT